MGRRRNFLRNTTLPSSTTFLAQQELDDFYKSHLDCHTEKQGDEYRFRTENSWSEYEAQYTSKVEEINLKYNLAANDIQFSTFEVKNIQPFSLPHHEVASSENIGVSIDEIIEEDIPPQVELDVAALCESAERFTDLDTLRRIRILEELIVYERANLEKHLDELDRLKR